MFHSKFFESNREGHPERVAYGDFKQALIEEAGVGNEIDYFLLTSTDRLAAEREAVRDMVPRLERAQARVKEALAQWRAELGI
jgi:hypothetical protein